jgi:hypothetical protein
VLTAQPAPKAAPSSTPKQRTLERRGQWHWYDYFWLVLWIVILTIIMSLLIHTPLAWLFVIAAFLSYILGDAIQLPVKYVSRRVPRMFSLLVRLTLTVLAVVIAGYYSPRLEPLLTAFVLTRIELGPLKIAYLTALVPIALVVYVWTTSEEFKDLLNSRSTKAVPDSLPRI